MKKQNKRENEKITSSCPNCGSEIIEYLEDQYQEDELSEQREFAGRRGLASYIMDIFFRLINLFTRKRRYFKCMACGYQWKNK